MQDLSAGGRIVHLYREAQIGGGRVDLIVDVLGNAYVLKLKMCGAGYPRSYAEDGFDQLKSYMQLMDTNRACLIVYDGRVGQSGEDAFPTSVDPGDGMTVTCTSINVFGIDAK